jgi:hypothetical protein
LTIPAAAAGFEAESITAKFIRSVARRYAELQASLLNPDMETMAGTDQAIGMLVAAPPDLLQRCRVGTPGALAGRAGVVYCLVTSGDLGYVGRPETSRRPAWQSFAVSLQE